MTASRSRGPIVIDTDVFSAELVPGSRLAERYAPVITGRKAFISFQTAAEGRYGALRRGWGTARMLKLETKIHRVRVVHTGPELVLVYAQPRADCEAAGHALAQREHNADRWIAASALRLGIPLVSNDGSPAASPASRPSLSRAPDRLSQPHCCFISTASPERSAIDGCALVRGAPIGSAR